MELWTAFTLGLLGSFHCVGMCGPIALSIPGSHTSTASLVFRGLFYNTGRVITYSVLGLILGVFGVGATISGYQNILSIALGALIVIFALIPKLKRIQKPGSLYAKFNSWISKTIGVLFKKKTVTSTLSIGILNGLLPCGLVVTALAAALITDSIFHSMVYMALFGLGTIPLMLFLNIAPGFITPAIRQKLRPFSIYFAIFIGLFLIARGFMMNDAGHAGHMMNLGVG